MKRRAIIGLLLLVFPATLGAQAPAPRTGPEVQATDPLLGTWELNPAKSSFKLSPPLKSETRTFTLVGEEIKVTSTVVTMDGKTEKSSWTLVYDGKDRPITGSDTADSLSVTRSDPYHATAVNKKDGKVIRTLERVISPDGRTLTFTSTGTNAKGESLKDVVVFEKK